MNTMRTSNCPLCGWTVAVWPRGVTVYFHCPNRKCKAGKGPWDTDNTNTTICSDCGAVCVPHPDSDAQRGEPICAACVAGGAFAS